MSADEIDAELLAMAGDSSDDDADDFDQTQAIEDDSADEEPVESKPRAAEAPTHTRGVAQKVKARGRRKRRQRESEGEEEDDDLGGRSSSPPFSPESGGVNDYDGAVDAVGESEDEVPLFPLEGKFENARDRETIMAMNEIEREELLAERAAQVLRRQQDLQLKKALADSRASANKSKRKAEAAELEDGGRRNTRPKTDKRSALDDYRKAREQKGVERSRVDSRRNDRDGRSASPHGSEKDADGESEVEWAEPVAEVRRDEPPAELKDFERCRVGRSNFARVCFYPGFEDAIRGCFCRVNIGISKETGQPQYRMTQIKGFTEGKPYNMENSSGKRFTTDQFAVVAHGSDEKTFPFAACSDGKFTEAEFARYNEALRKDNIRLPPRKLLNTKLDRIHSLLNTNFTEETLQLKFNKQKAMEMKYDPSNVARTKKEAIERRRAEAEETGDADEVEKCDAELAALMNNAAVSNGVKAKPNIPTNSGNLDRIAKLNQKNRSKTQQEVRQALVDERRKLQRERDEATARAAKAAQEKAAAQVAAAAKKVAENGAREHASRKEAGTPLGGTSSRTLGALKRKNLDDDVIGSLDLGIDLEI